MRRFGIVLWMVLTLILASAPVWGVSLCDYKSPETSLTDANLSFGYRYYDDINTAGVDVNSGRVTADYSQLADSPSFGFSIAGSAELALDAFMPTGWLGQGAATVRFYPLEDSPLFAFGGLQASMATGQLMPGVDVLVGGGVGRFSDVTPLAKAMFISRELQRLDAIAQPLSDSVLTSRG